MRCNALSVALSDVKPASQPLRIKMANDLIVGYGLDKKMEVIVSQEQEWTM